MLFRSSGIVPIFLISYATSKMLPTRLLTVMLVTMTSGHPIRKSAALCPVTPLTVTEI